MAVAAAAATACPEGELGPSHAGPVSSSLEGEICELNPLVLGECTCPGAKVGDPLGQAPDTCAEREGPQEAKASFSTLAPFSPPSQHPSYNGDLRGHLEVLLKGVTLLPQVLLHPITSTAAHQTLAQFPVQPHGPVSDSLASLSQPQDTECPCLLPPGAVPWLSRHLSPPPPAHLQ